MDETTTRACRSTPQFLSAGLQERGGSRGRGQRGGRARRAPPVKRKRGLAGVASGASPWGRSSSFEVRINSRVLVVTGVLIIVNLLELLRIVGA